jgi:2-oxoglutarate ferredoxin oxidoreductase subunit alpha
MINKLPIIKDDVSLVICGAAGQGIQTIEYFLVRIFKQSQFNIFSTREYMSRIRGGSNSTDIRISSKRVGAPVSKIDILFALNKDALTHLKDRISEKTVILGEKEKLGDEYEIVDVPFTKIASEIGGIIYANTIAVGVVSKLFQIDPEVIHDFLRKRFGKKGEEIVQNNINAIKKGYEITTSLFGSQEFEIKRGQGIEDEILLNGVEAVALGAIAGGCNFVSSYPMSPSTGVLTFLSQHAKEFNIIAEQAEDEISAINMVLGAWYAGGRAMVTTSGGGFALMCEGVSLAGMIESPVVIHLAQRPGPATGLPTRTEQGDLQLALYAGHGEFPRIILAPGNPKEAFYLTQKAFNLADKYQVPVFVLTDQFLIDSYYNMPNFDISDLKIENNIVKTDKNYKRYKFTENGLSPRGIPAFGEGLVCLDSDEHDEEGHITESMEIRTKMVDKRLRKMALIRNEIEPPKLIGKNDYKILIIGWGSNLNVVTETLERLGREDVSFLHFTQLYPLHPKTSDYLKKAADIIIIENNATSQFGNLIKLYTGFEIRKRILKYSGLPFYVEEVLDCLKRLIN